MANQKFDFKTPLLNAEDQPIRNGEKEVLLSDFLSSLIMDSSVQANTMKFFDWGLDLKKAGVITIDDSDRELLIGFINDNREATVLGKGRLLKVLQTSK